MPNEPPTLPVSTRTRFGSTPSTPAIEARMPNTPWQPRRSVQRPLAASCSPIAERGSIGATTMRLLRMRSRVTCAARANASATRAASP